MTYRQFSIRLICGSFALLALVGIFNRIVDPFWYYRDIEIKGFNAVKTKFRRFERDVKPALLIREQPEAIILGSSFSEIGFDPTNTSFTDHGRFKSMNFSLAGAPWELVQCSFEFAVTHARIKRALIGFHPRELPQADCAKDFASLGRINTGELLFSDRALQASIQTIQEQKNEKQSHTREGMYFYSRETPGVDRRFKEYYSRQTKKNPLCLKTAKSMDMLPDTADNKALDLSGLRRMIKTALEHNVELVLFAYPRHAYTLEMDRQCGDQAARWNALKQISSLVEVESARNKLVRAWYFYGYNDITAEPIGVTAKYWQDPEHFNFEMGDMMIKNMFGTDHGQTMPGKLLVSDRMYQDFQEFIAEREHYKKLHPEFQSNFRNLLPE